MDENAEVWGGFGVELTKEGFLGKDTSSCRAIANPKTGPGEHGAFLPLRGQVGFRGRGISLREPTRGGRQRQGGEK